MKDIPIETWSPVFVGYLMKIVVYVQIEFWKSMILCIFIEFYVQFADAHLGIYSLKVLVWSSNDLI